MELKHIIISERPAVAQAIGLIMPEFVNVPVVGRAGVTEVIASLEKGDVVAGNIDVPGLAKITEAGATFLGFGVSASKEELDTVEPTAEMLVSAEFKGRLQEMVAYRDEGATLPQEVEVYSNQLLPQICQLLTEKGINVLTADRIHPSYAEVAKGFAAKGVAVKDGPKFGVGRIGRNWHGRTVVGHMMPRHATEYCTAGAQYFHMELPGRPEGKHNHNWSVVELGLFGATFVKYDVWRWRKSVRRFDKTEAEINL